MVRVQELQNFLLGFFSAIAFKCFHIHARGVFLAQTRRELYLAMDGIIVRDEPADEPDDDGRRFCGRFLRRKQSAPNRSGRARERPQREKQKHQSKQTSNGVRSK